MLIAAMCSATWLCCSSVLPLRGEQQAKHSDAAKIAKNNLKISEEAKVCIKKLH